MEAKQFDLQHEIKNYRNQLLLNGNLTNSDWMEIEGHIKDAVESLTKVGLSEDEAFVITLKRTGSAELLSEEYNKVNPFFVSGKIRSFSITSLGLILSLGTIFLLLYDLTTLFRSVYLKQTTADVIIKASLYLSLCIGILAIVKWSNSFTIFLQRRIERQPFLTAAILFLLPLISFGMQSVIIRYIPGNETQEVLLQGLPVTTYSTQTLASIW